MLGLLADENSDTKESSLEQGLPISEDDSDVAGSSRDVVEDMGVMVAAEYVISPNEVTDETLGEVIVDMVGSVAEDDTVKTVLGDVVCGDDTCSTAVLDVSNTGVTGLVSETGVKILAIEAGVCALTLGIWTKFCVGDTPTSDASELLGSTATSVFNSGCILDVATCTEELAGVGIPGDDNTSTSSTSFLKENPPSTDSEFFSIDDINGTVSGGAVNDPAAFGDTNFVTDSVTSVPIICAVGAVVTRVG